MSINPENLTRALVAAADVVEVGRREARLGKEVADLFDAEAIAVALARETGTPLPLTGSGADKS